MSALRRAAQTALVAVALVTGAGHAHAQATPTLNDLLDEVKAQRAKRETRDRERLAERVTDRDEQRALVAKLTAEVAAAQARSAQLNRAFEANEKQLAAAQESLDIQLGDLKELFGVVRQESTQVRSVIGNSVINAQLGDRTALLDRLDEAAKLPSIRDLEALAVLIQEEMTEQANTVRFSGEIFDASGLPYTADIVRVGAFNLITSDRYLLFDALSGRVKELGRQPKARHRNNAAALFDARDGVVRMTLDPTHGQLLQALVRSPTVVERVAQGGFVGYTILALGALGLALAAWRILALLGSRAGIAAQLKATAPNANNALGRILHTYHANRDVDTDTLELKMDEAILRETPRLEQWQGAIKIIAAVAPLLGLLGTVIGMIETFQSITLYGTGDPRLMADGISKALVTTMLGLFIAIPLVLLHSFVAALSRGQIEILEEQSAGVVARQAEGA